MLRGIYTASSAMMVEQTRLDVISNNLSNVNTVGFKRYDVAVQSFHDVLIEAQGVSPKGAYRHPIGVLGMGADEVISYTSFAAGALRHTGNSLDVAISGEGFFVVQTPEGERYTRDGSFRIGPSSELVTSAGHPVLGENGPIILRGNRIDIDAQGVVYVDGRQVDKLRIVDFAAREGLRKQNSQYFESTESSGAAIPAENYVVSQEHLEQSNVEIVREMVNMINATRSYEMNQRMILSQDDALSKAVNDVGHI